MGLMFIFTILIIGLSGIVAQVLLLRELLVSFNGNELTIGIILGNWLMAEALGALLIGRLIERTKAKLETFVILEIVFALTLPLFIYACRTFKGAIGILPGQVLGLKEIFYVSLIITLPMAFCHGALFSVVSKIRASFFKDAGGSIGKVYSYETIGAIIGGIALTYVFIPYFNSFQMAFIITLANLILVLFFLRSVPRRWLKFLSWGIAAAVLSLSLGGFPGYLQRSSIQQQWKKTGRILDYRNSVYGNIMVTKKGEQDTFFYNGIPIITTPYPDITFVEEFAHFALLSHPDPKEVLVITAGAGGLINEILKQPVIKIDYAELDPLLIKLLKEYPSELTNGELSDSRVFVHNLDGRLLVRVSPYTYDVVFLGLSGPSDLSTNRFFTREFFRLVKKRLNPGGILTLRLPGSLTYVSQELKDLNYCILNALFVNFSYVRIIPGDYNIFLASDSGGIMQVTADICQERLAHREIKTNILTPAYLDYRLHPRWLKWFKQSYSGATTKLNQDLRPFAVFEMLIFWNKQFSSGIARALAFWGRLDLKIISIILAFISLALFYFLLYRPKFKKLALAYGIATTGLFAMLVNLMLLFIFQVFYGYVYHMLGILMSVFMAGIAIGGLLISRALEKIRDGLRLFINLEVAIVIFCLFLAAVLYKFAPVLHNLPVLLSALFFVPGFLVGLEFPLAAKLYLRDRRHTGQTAGLLYFADLLGGWIAGLLAGVVLLPVLGLFQTCLALVLLKISSIFLLWTNKTRF